MTPERESLIRKRLGQFEITFVMAVTLALMGDTISRIWPHDAGRGLVVSGNTIYGNPVGIFVERAP